MNTDNTGSWMIQHPLVQTLCNLDRKEAEQYAGMSDVEKAAFRDKLIEKMHADNICYAGCFSWGSLPGETERAAE